MGVARAEDLDDGIPNEAFKTLPDDDKAQAKLWRDKNKKDRRAYEKGLLELTDTEDVAEQLHAISLQFKSFEDLPDATLEQRQAKEKAFAGLTGSQWHRMKQVADVRTAQFFIPKTEENHQYICTDAPYRRLLASRKVPYDPYVHKAAAVALERRLFNWFLEFPEVFDQGGFDCILGNPPFLGGKKVSTHFGKEYLNYVKNEYAPAGAIDLVGYFFRRIFGLLREQGAMGLIATNTIAQGSTRKGSLAAILKRSGTINFGVRSMKWPGVAALEVALVTIQKGLWAGRFVLDGNDVETINSYLSDEEPLGDPHKLVENANRSFIGSFIYGMGFVTEPDEALTLVEINPNNSDVLFPFLNGKDLNNRPDQSPSRWVINFFDWSLEKTQHYSDCLQLIEERVKSERLSKAKDVASYPWWQHWRPRLDLYRAIAKLERVLVHTAHTKTHAFTFAPADQVFSHALVVFAYDENAYYAILQSSLHEYWAWEYASTMKTDRRYTPSSCYETFPFPRPTEEQTAALENIGEHYHEHRRQLMLLMNLGLTKTYNLFHIPSLSVEAVAKASKQDKDTAELALDALHDLRAVCTSTRSSFAMAR